MIELPRYKLRAGERLRYRMCGDPQPGSRTQVAGLRFSIDWDFYVIGRNADGLWRLVFSESRTQERETASGERTARTIGNDGFFDLAEDGRVVENWTITPLANPTIIFPRLPADRMELESGWHSTLELDGTQRRYLPASLAAVDGSTRRFVENCQTRLDPIYEALRQREYAFDVQQGRVTNITTTFQRGWPADSEPMNSTDTICLSEVAQPADVESARARQEADRYFEICVEYQRLIDLALWDVSRSAHWLDTAAEALERLEPTIRVEFLRELLRGKLRLHRDESGGLISDAEKIAGLIDKPAADWQSVDLDGHPHGLKDYAGKALVLCFWNRGCTWSLRTLLALGALAAEMRAQPVAFLGVSADRNREDAAFVWRTLEARFPTVMDIHEGQSVSSSLGVDSFPTTVVIDPCGIVRRIRTGHSFRLSSALAIELERLASGIPMAAAMNESQG